MQTIGYLNDADIVISEKKSESMHVGLHPTTRMSATKEAEIAALKHGCHRCSRTFATLRELRIHISRWCRAYRV